MERPPSLYTDALYIFTGLFVTAFVPTKLVLCINQGNILPKTCTNAGTFRVTFGQSFEACIDECQRRKRCEIVMYKHGINECSLKDSINTEALTGDQPVCLFTNINDWERTGRSPCDKNNCGLTETCVTSTIDPKKFDCVKSECLRPQAINNASVFSNQHGIGYKNGYTCDSMFIGKGDPFITCKNNGRWTSTTFACVRIGRKPAPDTRIAELISVDGEKWVEGTKVTFACRPGYQGKGTNATSVLNSQGKWQPDHVQCCNENITDIVRWKNCLATFNGSFASKFTDMKEYCKDKGGYMKIISPQLAKHLFPTVGYHWLVSGANKTFFHDSLKKCFSSSKADDLLKNFSNYTYAELVHKVVSRDLKGHWTCGTARWWARNDNASGNNEDCVVFRNGTYGMLNVTCSSVVSEKRHHAGFICNTLLPEI